MKRKLSYYYEADNKTLEDANKAFEQLRTAIEELSLSDISDSKEFVQFWGDTDRASKEITKLNSGYLNAPQKPESVKGKSPEPVFENGKQCHFIDAKDPEIGFDANTEKTARTFKREWVPCDAPLFSRDPSPDDVAQGYIGDCWLVSSLAAIAASNPDKIKEMMHQNDDNTVTVRLYNMAGEPVFVTVNDSVAELQGKTKTLDAYAQGARWVQLIEKAYVQSGLGILDENSKKDPNYYVSQAENGTRKFSYADIEGGYSVHAFNTLLGRDINNTLKLEKVNINYEAHLNKPIFTGQYDAEEQAVFYNIKNSIDQGKSVTASTPKFTAANQGVNNKEKQDTNYDIVPGLPGGHAYTVLNTFENNGIKYIQIRNPHAGVGRDYKPDENGRPVPYSKDTPETGGVSTLELTDFMQHFRSYTTTAFDITALDKKQFEKGEEMRKLYGEALRDVCNIIDNSSDFAASKYVSSPQFNNLREQSAVIQKHLNDPNINPEAFKQDMERFFNAADMYTQYRDNQPKSERKELKERSVNRYLASNMLTELKKKVKENDKLEPEQRQPVKSENLKETILNDKVNLSRAKMAMQKVVSEKQQQLQNNTPSKFRRVAVNRIQQFQNQSFKEMEKAYTSGNKDKFIANMSQYMYVKDVQQNEKNMSDKVLEERLNPKLIKADAARAEAQLKQILKNVSVDDLYNNVMCAENPEKVLSALVRQQGGAKLTPEEANLVKWNNQNPQRQTNAAQNQMQPGMAM